MSHSREAASAVRTSGEEEVALAASNSSVSSKFSVAEKRGRLRAQDWALAAAKLGDRTPPSRSVGGMTCGERAAQG